MSQVNNRRIAKNTLVLYVRMLFLMMVSLYTSRVILNALGVEDYGIYNVVGGIVTMFTILSGSLSAAIHRFASIEEVVDAYRFCIDNPFVNGSMIEVNGGYCYK